MGNYGRGYAFELRVKKFLEGLDRFEGEGYFVVRSAGSHGIADLVALDPLANRTLLIQCKRQGAISMKEWNALYWQALRLGCRPILAQMRGKRGIALYVLTGERTKRGQFPAELLTIS